MRTTKIAAAGCTALVSVALAVGAVTLPASASVVGAPKVKGPWARSTSMGQMHGAAYLVLQGTGSADRLVSASVPKSVAMSAELHKTVMGADGKMTMKQVRFIPVPPGGTVRLEPGGYHVMLMDLAKPLRVGSSFKLTLGFARSGTVKVMVPVKQG
jgi:copper(I)-binding protein